MELEKIKLIAGFLLTILSFALVFTVKSEDVESRKIREFKGLLALIAMSLAIIMFTSLS